MTKRNCWIAKSDEEDDRHEVEETTKVAFADLLNRAETNMLS
jgi:hypothetical protein